MLACRERETVEAERRGDLGRDVRGLDLDDFGTEQRMQGLVEDGDEITYVLRPSTQQADPATVVIIERKPGETLDGPGSTVGRELEHDSQLQPTRVCRFEVHDSQTARHGEASTNGEAHESAGEKSDVELGHRSAGVGQEGRDTGGAGSVNVAAPGQANDGSRKVGHLPVASQVCTADWCLGVHVSSWQMPCTVLCDRSVRGSSLDQHSLKCCYAHLHGCHLCEGLSLCARRRFPHGHCLLCTPLCRGSKLSCAA